MGLVVQCIFFPNLSQQVFVLFLMSFELQYDTSFFEEILRVKLLFFLNIKSKNNALTER